MGPTDVLPHPPPACFPTRLRLHRVLGCSPLRPHHVAERWRHAGCLQPMARPAHRPTQHDAPRAAHLHLDGKQPRRDPRKAPPAPARGDFQGYSAVLSSGAGPQCAEIPALGAGASGRASSLPCRRCRCANLALPADGSVDGAAHLVRPRTVPRRTHSL